MKTCPKCRTTYDDKFEFCHHCGLRLQNDAVLTFCPYCGNKLEIWGEFCPYCGKSLEDKSLSNNEQKPVNNINKPLLPEVNIKKNYVKMQPLTFANKESNAGNSSNLNTTQTGNVKKNYVKMQPLDNSNSRKNKNDSSSTESVSNGGIKFFIVCCLGVLVINALVYNLWLSNLCSIAVLCTGANALKEYYQSKRIVPLIATMLILIITIGGLGILKSVGKAELRKRVLSQHPVTIVNDIAFL